MERTIYQVVFQTSIFMVMKDTEVNMLKNNEKIKVTHTKDMLIKQIVEDCEEDIATVKSFYNALESNIARILSSADEDTNISIRLFEGIVLNSEFVPEKTKVNNLTGKTITTNSKVKPSAHITRYYCDKITNYNN